MPDEVGANPQAVTDAEIWKNILNDLGSFPVIHTTEDAFLHAFDYALSNYRPQSAKDRWDAPWGATFTVASCVTVANANTVTTASSITSVKKGQYVTGTGITVGTQVMAVGTGAFVLSLPATAAGTVTLTFYPPCLGETTNRSEVTSVTIATSTGVLYVAGVSLNNNVTISNLVLQPGTTGDAGPTHQWMGLWDWRGNQLATSADATSTAITASTPTVYPIATTAAGAATSYVTAYAGLYYIGVCLTTGNAPVLTAEVSFTGVTTLPPILTGTATGQAAPFAFPATLGTITPTANRYYFYCY
jgi:hypothetical protein